MKIDLHIHTCYSDGACTPEEIVCKYRKENYDFIAITDHDTVDGVQEAIAAGDAAGLAVVPGIELSTADRDGVEMHILGYSIDPKNAALSAKLKELRQARRLRNELLLAYLAEQGYSLCYEDLLVGKCGDYIGKPDFGRAMVRKGYLQTPQEIFKAGMYLETPEAKSIKKKKMDTQEAIALISAAGGKAVLAHPIQIKAFGVPGGEEYFARLRSLLLRLCKEGLKGIEAYHPDHNTVQSAQFSVLAEEYGLFVTRGSDFHGDDFEKRK